MLQEKCTKDINQIIHKALTRSFINEFSSRLNVNIGEEGGMEGGDAQTNDDQIPEKSTQRSNSQKLQKNPNVTAGGSAPNAGAPAPSLPPKSKGADAAALMKMLSLKKEISNSGAQLQRSPSMASKSEVNLEGITDPIEFASEVKKLATVTDHDIIAHKRQKQGQVRIGDVVMLAYHYDVYKALMDDHRAQVARQSLMENKTPVAIKRQRTLERPDSKYKGYVFSNGISDQGVNVIPQINKKSQNAQNLFKQCLFKIEIQ